jgi:hypothetical protein
MEGLEQFFKDNQRGYPRDPRRMAYAKLQKNTQGMDREQLEAFITANLFIPHSQYKMALGNLIQFLKKQDQMSKLNEIKEFKKLAGLLKEGYADYESESGDTASMGNINEAGAKWQSKLNPEVNGIEIYNDGDNRLFVIFDKNTGGISIINDFNGGDFDEIWGTDRDVRPELLASINGGSEVKEWEDGDEEEDEEEGYDTGIPSDEELFGLSEDADYESESGDTNAMGDTDAMNVSEWAGMSPEHANTFDLMDKLKDFRKAGKLSDANFKKAEDYIHKNAADLYYDYPDAEHALKQVFKAIKASVSIGTEYTVDSVVPAVQKLADELVAKGKYKPEQSKRVVAYAANHKDELLKKLSSPIQWFNTSAERTQHGTK